MFGPANKRIPVLAFLLYVAHINAMPVATSASDVPLASYQRAQTLITLPDGRRLNLFCLGTGTPAVILESGGGDDSISFRRVQGRLAATTRVCSYDRAGMGFSDPSAVPDTTAHIVSDLHALIERADIPRPVILVGHSNGGLYVRLYASTYPDDVAGMVMIDPNSVGLNMAAERQLDPRQLKAWRDSDGKDVADARRCYALAERGELSRSPARYPTCMDAPPNADPALHALLNRQLARPSQQKAQMIETIDLHPKPDGGLSDGEQVVQRVPFDFGNKPFIVLSGTHEQGGLPAMQRRKVIKAMLANQADLAAHSSQGKQVLVDAHDEYIQTYQPDAVVNAVTEVVARVRQ